MSATNRGGQRSPADYYPTPAWCVARLLEAVDLPDGLWIEPCAGVGDIVAAVQATGRSPRWAVNELRAECRPALQGLCRAQDSVSIGPMEDWAPPGRAAVAITNPPFRLAQEVVAWCRQHADVAVLLLRLNFVGSERRAPLMRAHPPDVYVLPNRPSFTGKGTDSVEYAWFVWDQRRAADPAAGGRLRVLDLTPAAARQRPPERPSARGR